MARNGSGTMSILNTFVSGTTITASDHNENFSDIATELTNSVAVDGQSTMTGAFMAASGTVAAPGITFGADTDSGLYRIGANNIGVAVNGAKVLDIATTGLDIVGAITNNGGDALTIVGEVKIYAGATAPTGWLFCYGQAISRTTYATLFAVIGTTYGVGDGSTTFNVPDIRGRVIAGQDDMGGTSANRLTNADDGLDGDTLGATGGGETQTLVTANLPAYTPAGSISGTANLRYIATSAIAGANLALYTTAAGTANTETITATFTGTAQGGTSTAFGVVQPTIVLNYIIKT